MSEQGPLPPIPKRRRVESEQSEDPISVSSPVEGAPENTAVQVPGSSPIPVPSRTPEKASWNGNYGQHVNSSPVPGDLPQTHVNGGMGGMRRPLAFPSQSNHTGRNGMDNLEAFRTQTARFQMDAEPPQGFVPRPAYDMSSSYGAASQGRPVSMKSKFGSPHSPLPPFANDHRLSLFPSGTVSPAYQQMALELMDIFQNIGPQIVFQALVQSHFNKDDAAALLSDDSNVRRLIFSASGASNISPGHNMGRTISPRPPQQSAPKSSMRDLRTDAQSIRNKYSNRQAVDLTLPTPSPVRADQIPQHTPQTVSSSPVPKPRRRLKKKSNIEEESEEDLSDMDDDSDDQPEEIVPEVDTDQIALDFLNTCSVKDLADLVNCSVPNAEIMVNSRPYLTAEEARAVKSPDADQPADAGKKKRGRREKITLGSKVVDICAKTLQGYDAVDSLINSCRDVGTRLQRVMKSWGVTTSDTGALEVTSAKEPDDGSLPSYYLRSQPSTLGPGVQLKSYQRLGLNWLRLLYEEKLSGILADEMGLGKTCQVVSFLAALQAEGNPGPHLIVVPSSTLENWLRELGRFAPTFKVETYYGSQNERAEIRYQIQQAGDYHIMVTTYQLATGSKDDRKFLRGIPFDCCIFDEGHYLKNSMSDRYKHLMNIRANFRLLLTGTPLQNNLKELVSLLSFILPDLFAEELDRLEAIFRQKKIVDSGEVKAKGVKKELPALESENTSASGSPAPNGASEDDISSSLLSAQRIRRAKSIMTPFVLRRRKVQVLGDLPPKHQHIEKCYMTDRQRGIYDGLVEMRKRSIRAREEGKALSKENKASSNVTMHLRQAANHPMLFRRLYTDEMIKQMSRRLMMEPEYAAHGSDNERYIREDLSVCSDFELHRMCSQTKGLAKFMLPGKPWMDAGKVQALQRLLPMYRERGDRVLIFSQFTMMLDILQKVMDEMQVQYMRMDGQTPVNMRQDMLDQYHDETDVTVFLLSTKAGGFGINLACANVVILFDASFNPHDDRQAEDRAHRVGQENEVHVVRLVMQESIDVYIQSLANTKLALDDTISGQTESQHEAKGRQLVEQMLDQASPAQTDSASLQNPE